MRTCRAFLIITECADNSQQDYSTFDSRSSAISTAFFLEAKGRWEVERNQDCANTLAALSYFTISCLWSGRDEMAMQVIDDARNMPPRLKLFDVRPTQDLTNSFLDSSPDDIRALSHIAWGSYGLLM